jgi:hypothetical protein
MTAIAVGQILNSWHVIDRRYIAAGQIAAGQGAGFGPWPPHKRGNVTGQAATLPESCSLPCNGLQEANHEKLPDQRLDLAQAPYNETETAKDAY